MSYNKEERQRIENTFEALIGITSDLQRMVEVMKNIPSEMKSIVNDIEKANISIDKGHLNQIAGYSEQIAEQGENIKSLQSNFVISIKNELSKVPKRVPMFIFYILIGCLLLTSGSLIFGFVQRSKKENIDLQNFTYFHDLKEFQQYMIEMKKQAPNTHELLLKDFTRLERYDSEESSSN